MHLVLMGTKDFLNEVFWSKDKSVFVILCPELKSMTGIGRGKKPSLIIF